MTLMIRRYPPALVAYQKGAGTGKGNLINPLDPSGVGGIKRNVMGTGGGQEWLPLGNHEGYSKQGASRGPKCLRIPWVNSALQKHDS